MNIYTIVGVAAFVLFIMYDFNQISGNRLALRLFFPLGIAILIFSSVRIALISPAVAYPGRGLSALFWFTAAVFFSLLIYTLFFAVPFDAAYVKGSKQRLCTTGVYAICRHPGVLFLAAAYVFSALAMGKIGFLIAGAIFSVCNVIYVVIQDKWIFPRVFEGYEEYQKTVHFLLPLGRMRS